MCDNLLTPIVGCGLCVVRSLIHETCFVFCVFECQHEV